MLVRMSEWKHPRAHLLLSFITHLKGSSGGRLGNEAVTLRGQRAPLHYNNASRELFAEALRPALGGNTPTQELFAPPRRLHQVSAKATGR